MRDHKTKLISIPKLKPSLFQLHNFDPYTEVKSSSIPNIKQVNFDASTKTKSFSTPTQKVNNDSRTKKQVHFDTNTKNKSNSIQRLKLSHFRPHTKTQSISSLQWIQVKFDHTEIKSNSTPHVDIVSSQLGSLARKTKLISMIILKTSGFPPAYTYQVNCSHPYNQTNLIPAFKSSQVRFPTLRSRQFRQPQKPS